MTEKNAQKFINKLQKLFDDYNVSFITTDDGIDIIDKYGNEIITCVSCISNIDNTITGFYKINKNNTSFICSDYRNEK